MTRRRVIWASVISLGLGVVTTYGVAWWLMNTRVVEEPFPGLMTSLPVDGSGLPPSTRSGWKVTIESRAGVSAVFSERVAVVYAGDAAVRVFPEESFIPRWSVAVREAAWVDAAVPLMNAVVTERAAGWPFLAVVDRRVKSSWGPRAGVEELGSWTVEVGRPDMFGLRTALALRPIWWGMMGDSVVFGGPLALVVWGRGIGKRWWRRRAGVCVRCRYDLRGMVGEVCPECGGTVGGGPGGRRGVQ